MFKIDNSTASVALPAPAAVGTPGFFTGGNPATATPPTVLDADFMNMLMLEVVNVVLAAGLTPSKTTYTQMRDAILAMINGAVGSISAVPPSRRIDTAGIAIGGGDLTTNRTITVPKASQSDAVNGTDDAKAITAFALAAAIATRAYVGRTLSVGGLVQGGGDLTNDRAFVVPKASGADVRTGTDDTKAITPASLAGGYQGSLTTPGWMRHPNGFIEQWGSVLSSAAGGSAITFPIPFPNSCFGASAVNTTSGPSSDAWPAVGNLSVTGMTIYTASAKGVDGGSGIGTIWRAWGK